MREWAGYGIAIILGVALWYQSCGPRPPIQSENIDSVWANKIELAKEEARREGADSVQKETLELLAEKDEEIATLEGWRSKAVTKLRILREIPPAADSSQGTMVRHLTEALILCDSALRIDDSLFAKQEARYQMLYGQFQRDSSRVRSLERSIELYKENEEYYKQEIEDLTPGWITQHKDKIGFVFGLVAGFYIATRL